MLRYKLRTLLILLAVGPPMLGVIYRKVDEYQRQHRASAHLRQIGLALANYHGDIFISLPPGARVRVTPSPQSDQQTDEPDNN
jgi:hypothetical protein